MRLEAKWIAMFEQVFELCGVQRGDACAVLSETQTRPELPQLAELACVLAAFAPHEEAPPDAADLRKLMEMYPDG